LFEWISGVYFVVIWASQVLKLTMKTKQNLSKARRCIFIQAEQISTDIADVSKKHRKQLFLVLKYGRVRILSALALLIANAEQNLYYQASIG